MQRHPEGLGSLAAQQLVRKGIPPLLAQTPSFEPNSRVWARSGLRALVSSQLRPPVPQSHMQQLLRPAPAPVAASVSPGGTQGPPTSGNTVLDAVLLGVQQLQTLQAQHISSGKKEDAPETVKTGIATFPKLASPDPAGGSLEFQDWLQLIAGLMSDFRTLLKFGGQGSPGKQGCVR